MLISRSDSKEVRSKDSPTASIGVKSGWMWVVDKDRPKGQMHLLVQVVKRKKKILCLELIECQWIDPGILKGACE